MPFIVPFLRTTLLISSVTLAASYALYANNEPFRNFVDGTVDRILSAWDHVLASLSPEERERQREAQRREVLVALTTRGNVDGVRSVVETASGNDAEAQNEKGVRRRRLYEAAQRNAASIKAGISAIADELEPRLPGAQSASAPIPATSSSDSHSTTTHIPPPTLYSNLQFQSGVTDTTAASASAPDPPEVLPEESTSSASGTAFASSEKLRTIAIQTDQAASTEIPVSRNTIPTDNDDAVSISGTSTASMSSFSAVLTPTSPSVRSLSEFESASASQEDPFESTHETRDRLGSMHSASTETMSHFTQSAPPSVADDESLSQWSDFTGEEGGDMHGVSELEVDEEDPSSAAAWAQHARNPEIFAGR